MWRSRAHTLILHWSSRQKFILLPPKPTALFKPSPPKPFKWCASICPGFLNPKFYSSATDSSSEEEATSLSALGFEKNIDFTLQEVDRFSVELGESDTSPNVFDEGAGVGFAVLNDNEIEEGDGLSSLWEESIDRNAPLDAKEIGEELAAEVQEVNIDQLESVASILQRTLPQDIGSSLDMLEELSLTEEFVVRVFQESQVSGENLVSFFRWAIKKAAEVNSLKVLHHLIQTISTFDEIGKMEAYMLWDLTKELSKMKGIIVTTEMLNQLISIFCKLGKAKAGLEVFNMFDEFGCVPDGNTYYCTIEALGKKSMIDKAWSVCEKMLNSGNLPDVEKIGKIIIFFCKGKRAKEAHLVYLLAKENDVFPGRDALSFLVGGLCRNEASVYLALELLDEYQQKSIRYEHKTFYFVAQSLVRIKDAKAAKSLLLRMGASGPPPGNSVFHLVITGLCKEGEVEDAIALIKVMESKGLRPDVRTYSVIMNAFAKAGLMNEAFKIFCQSKKKHKLLTPMPYHILIRGYCNMEEYEKALECLKDMKEHGVQPTSDEYSILIKTLCLKALDWHTAEKLSEEMKESGLQLKRETQSLIAAVKVLEEEEIAADESKMEA